LKEDAKKKNALKVKVDEEVDEEEDDEEVHRSSSSIRRNTNTL